MRRSSPAPSAIQKARGSRPRYFNLESEARIIGAVLADNACWKNASSLLADHFSDAVYKEIWGVVATLLQGQKQASAATVATALGPRLEDLGGRDMLADLVYLGRQSLTTVSESVLEIQNLAQWRRLETIHASLSESLGSGRGTADEAISRTMNALQDAVRNGQHVYQTKRDVVTKLLQDFATPTESTPTGIVALDLLMQGGLVEGRTYGLGAPYGRGKTILMGTISDNVNQCDVPHLVLTLETPPADIEIRTTARHLELNAIHISDGYDPQHAVFVQNGQRYLSRMKNHTFYEHCPGIGIDEVIRVILRYVHQHNIKGVFIDYLQVITGQGKGQSRDVFLNEIGNRLVAICRQENIWGVFFVQAEEHGRETELVAIKRPLSMFIRMERDPNDATILFSTEKNNYGRLGAAGNDDHPGAIFDPAGPHIRSPRNTDYPDLARDDIP